jgi:hypothetical protein
LIGIRTYIEGDKELADALKKLGREAIKDADLKRGLRKLAKPFIEDIQDNINNVTGNLEKSIGIIRKTKSKRGKPYVLIGPRYYKPYKGYHAHLVEAGNSFYNVEFDEQKNIERAYNKNKTRTNEELKQLILTELNKKIKRLKL